MVMLSPGYLPAHLGEHGWGGGQGFGGLVRESAQGHHKSQYGPLKASSVQEVLGPWNPERRELWGRGQASRTQGEGISECVGGEELEA